jgi:hypothetical protein
MQDSIVSMTSDRTLRELRIAQAYVKLLCIPGGCSEASVSLGRIGRCEIRIFRGSPPDSDDMPLFWIELFDHGAKQSVDSFSCHAVKDALVVVEDFIWQAGLLNETSGPDGEETQG